MSHDIVNHPEHYTAGGIETIEYLQAKLSPEAYRGFLRGNALKYLSRMWLKDNSEAITDARKAQWYINRLVDSLSGAEPTVVKDSFTTQNDDSSTIEFLRAENDALRDNRLSDPLLAATFRHHTAHIAQLTEQLAAKEAECNTLKKDKERLDFLQDLNNKGQYRVRFVLRETAFQSGSQWHESKVAYSVRAAIDEYKEWCAELAEGGEA